MSCLVTFCAPQSGVPAKNEWTIRPDKNNPLAGMAVRKLSLHIASPNAAATESGTACANEKRFLYV